MKKVRKAVIPAAGFGTRFLPATKAMAKEMLPIVDKPTIQFIVEEAIASGIEDILIVTGKSKRPIEDHFDSNIELEANLREKGKNELLELVQETTGLRIHFVRQSYPLGLGHAVLQAKAFVGDEPFVVMLGDDLMEDEVPLTKQLMDAYERTHASNIAVMEVPHEETSKYGIIDPDQELEPGLFNVRRFVEKTESGRRAEQFGYHRPLLADSRNFRNSGKSKSGCRRRNPVDRRHRYFEPNAACLRKTLRRQTI